MMLKNDIQKIRTEAEKMANKQSKKLLKAYKQSLDEVRAELGNIYAKHAKDGVISANKAQRASILMSLEKQMLSEVKKINALETATTSEILKNGYQDSYYKTLYAIDRGLSNEINFTLLNPRTVEKAVKQKYKGKLYSDRIWKNKKLLTKRLKKEIERGIIKGESVDKVARRVSKTFGSSAYESQRLIHTELARVVTDAQEEIYKDSRVVTKVMYDATLDNKTSEICQELDGKTFDSNSSYPKPPQHPNCRSVIIPVVENWNPSKRKDNETKENIDYTTYEKWAKSKGL